MDALFQHKNAAARLKAARVRPVRRPRRPRDAASWPSLPYPTTHIKKNLPDVQDKQQAQFGFFPVSYRSFTSGHQKPIPRLTLQHPNTFVLFTVTAEAGQRGGISKWWGRPAFAYIMSLWADQRLTPRHRSHPSAAPCHNSTLQSRPMGHERTKSQHGSHH